MPEDDRHGDHRQRGEHVPGVAEALDHVSRTCGPGCSRATHNAAHQMAQPITVYRRNLATAISPSPAGEGDERAQERNEAAEEDERARRCRAKPRLGPVQVLVRQEVRTCRPCRRAGGRRSGRWRSRRRDPRTSATMARMITTARFIRGLPPLGGMLLANAPPPMRASSSPDRQPHGRDEAQHEDRGVPR